MVRFADYITEMEHRTAVFSFSRFNPPTTGHSQIANALVSSMVNRRDVYLFGKTVQNDTLSEEDQLKYMRMLIPKFASNLVVNEKFERIIDVAVWLDQKGYSSIRLVTPSEELNEMKSALHHHNGVHGDHGFYKFDRIHVVRAKREIDDRALAENMLAAVANNDLKEFAKGLPPTYLKTEELFNTLQEQNNDDSETAQ